MRLVASLAPESTMPSLTPQHSDLSGTCGILIPAFNEEKTVSEVVQAAIASDLGPVLVIDDGSTDRTVERALQTGASVLSLSKNCGKGKAITIGAESMQTNYILMIDADLLGLTEKHLKDLADPVLTKKADMTRGYFRGGRWQTTAAQIISPQLSGQRMLSRENLLRIPGIENSGYGIEIAITTAARKSRWKIVEVPFTGVSQVLKEEKRGVIKGLRSRIHMYWDILVSIAKGFGS